jgi:hypothetical protein
MKKNTHGYMTVWYTKGIYLSFVNCFVVILLGRRTQPIRKLLNELLITSALNPTCLLQSALNPTCLLQVNDVPVVILPHHKNLLLLALTLV